MKAIDWNDLIPLEWVPNETKLGWKCHSQFFYGEIYVNIKVKWTLDDGMGLSEHDFSEDAKVIAFQIYKSRLIELFRKGD